MIEALILLFVVALDQITKQAAVQLLRPIGEYKLWENVFHLTYAQNQGAAFSILQNQRWILIGVTSVACLALLVYLAVYYRKLSPWIRTSITLIVAGGVGNLIDRTLHGYVVDFFYFVPINFPIFNVADIAAVTGCIMMMVWVLFVKRDLPLLGGQVPRQAAVPMAEYPPPQAEMPAQESAEDADLSRSGENTNG